MKTYDYYDYTRPTAEELKATQEMVAKRNQELEAEDEEEEQRRKNEALRDV